MPISRKLTAKEVALVICFTALYSVFASIPIFQILGLPSRSITAAAITAPIIGIVLGPYIGVLSVVLGGIISFYAGAFLPSFVSGIVATLCAGLLYKGKRILCVLVYFLFLVIFGFYPSIGPVWLFPLSMWFQVAGLLILISPFQSMAIREIRSRNNSRFFLAFFIISLTSTLAGQISGSLAYVLVVSVPAGGWLALWQSYTIVYPIERIIIALSSTLAGVPLLRVLQSANLIHMINREHQERPS